MAGCYGSSAELTREQIERAVRLQRLGYRLLRWIADEVDAGRLTFHNAHDFAAAPPATMIEIFDRLWLPVELVCEPADRESLANLMSTYLFTSFELVDSPEPRFVGPGCRCPICTYLVAGSSLRPIRLREIDHRRARELERRHLRTLADELGATLTDAQVSEIATDTGLHEPLALHAYVRELLLRLDGVITGPEVLALWRRFAWRPEGSPKPGFELTVELIAAAVRRLATRVSPSSGTPPGSAPG